MPNYNNGFPLTPPTFKTTLRTPPGATKLPSFQSVFQRINDGLSGRRRFRVWADLYATPTGGPAEVVAAWRATPIEIYDYLEREGWAPRRVERY